MTGNTKRWLPVAVVILAIAAMAVAGRRDGGMDGGVGTGVWGGGRVVAALAALALLVVIATNFAKHRDGGYGLLHRAGTATAVVLTVAAVLTPIGLLFFGRKPEPPPQESPAPPVKGTPRFPMPSRSVHPGSGKDGLARAVGLSLLFLVVAAVFALLVYVLVRLLSRRWFVRLPLELVDFDPLGPELEQLAEAVAAGTEALEYEGDAREAVIACYSAMELAVSAGGGGRRATDTPEEFLRRVTAANLIPDEPARRLTELFREARFSRHRIAEDKRDAAREALRVISVHIQGRAAALAAEAAQKHGAQAAQATRAATPAGGSH